MKEPTEPDHYRALGLNFRATKAQVKTTFNKLAKKWHPDKASPSKQMEATRFFQRLRHAHDVLSDVDHRKTYDAEYAKIKPLWDAYERQLKVLETKKARRAKYCVQELRIEHGIDLTDRFSQSMVVLRSATEDFCVHENIITRRSDFMQRRLERSEADENNKRVIDMTDEQGDVICAYVNFLYENKVDTELCHKVMAFDGAFNDHDSICHQQVFLAQLLVFAEEIKDNAFFNEVVDTLAMRVDSPCSQGIRRYPGAGPIQLVYEGTCDTSPARAMLVHMYAECAREDWLCEDPDYLPKQFTYDLLRKVLRTRPTPPKTPCLYNRRMDWHRGCS